VGSGVFVGMAVSEGAGKAVSVGEISVGAASGMAGDDWHADTIIDKITITTVMDL